MSTRSHILTHCDDCDAEFMITKWELDVFSEFDLKKPTRCPACNDAIEIGQHTPRLLRQRANGKD